MVCEVRPANKDGRVTYGANEFVIEGKVCRYVLKVPEVKRD
jgi:hypothetical protein